MVNYGHKMTKIFKIGTILWLPILFEKMRKIQRIFTNYKGKNVMNQFLILKLKKDLSAKFGSTDANTED